MRLVLDTNVIVAAFATRGLCAGVFELCVKDHEIYLSEYILTECKEKFKSKLKLPAKKTAEIIAYLHDISETVTPEPIKKNIIKDQDDLPIIGTALSAKAKFLITGDKALLHLKKVKQVQIVSPRTFWEILRR